MWNKDLMQDLGEKRALLETMCELLDIAHSVPDHIYNEVFSSSEDEWATDRVEWHIYMLKEEISNLEQAKLEDYNSNNPLVHLSKDRDSKQGGSKMKITVDIDSKKELKKLIKLLVQNGKFIGADLSYADLTDADLSQALLYDADLHGAVLNGADLYGASLTEVNLDEADLSKASFRKAEFNSGQFVSADFSDTVFHCAHFGNADLRTADLTGADLRGADLTGADLTEASLGGACLDKADLRNSKFEGADLRGSDVSDAQRILKVIDEGSLEPDEASSPVEELVRCMEALSRRSE